VGGGGANIGAEVRTSAVGAGKYRVYFDNCGYDFIPILKPRGGCKGRKGAEMANKQNVRGVAGRVGFIY
jgi:hypothetical protein